MSSFVIPMDELMKKADPMYSEMNDITTAYIYAVPDPSIRELIPPPLELTDPAMLSIYVSNINQPTFGEAYMEGGIGVMTNLTDESGVTHTGLYYFNLQLCGLGAQNATFFGREEAGLPKKFANTISLKREHDNVFFHIERNGVRLLDAQLTIGGYNEPGFSTGLEGLDPSIGLMKQDSVLTHRYTTGDRGIRDMNIYYYDSPTLYWYYEPAFANVNLQSSIYDPWGEIKIAKVLGGAWTRNNNYVVDVTKIHSYPDEDAINVMRYLYPGRFDPLAGRR
ncbi:MAG: acetoacetate decarboxylase family protein [Defluviitaleaceae bacterium]|nr:acetoacetate decarboxylase family protein [Defluviitaleaceae bacterium]